MWLRFAQRELQRIWKRKLKQVELKRMKMWLSQFRKKRKLMLILDTGVINLWTRSCLLLRVPQIIVLGYRSTNHCLNYCLCHIFRFPMPKILLLIAAQTSDSPGDKINVGSRIHHGRSFVASGSSKVFQFVSSDSCFVLSVFLLVAFQLVFFYFFFALDRSF